MRVRSSANSQKCAEADIRLNIRKNTCVLIEQSVQTTMSFVNSALGNLHHQYLSEIRAGISTTWVVWISKVMCARISVPRISEHEVLWGYVAIGIT